MLYRAGLWLVWLTCAGAYQSDYEDNRVDYDDYFNDDSYNDSFKNLAMLNVINAARKRSTDELETRNSQPGKDFLVGPGIERPLPKPKKKVKDVRVKPINQKQIRGRRSKQRHNTPCHDPYTVLYFNSMY